MKTKSTITSDVPVKFFVKLSGLVKLPLLSSMPETEIWRLVVSARMDLIVSLQRSTGNWPCASKIDVWKEMGRLYNCSKKSQNAMTARHTKHTGKILPWWFPDLMSFFWNNWQLFELRWCESHLIDFQLTVQKLLPPEKKFQNLKCSFINFFRRVLKLWRHGWVGILSYSQRLQINNHAIFLERRKYCSKNRWH